jgi:hypothetical protein
MVPLPLVTTNVQIAATVPLKVTLPVAASAGWVIEQAAMASPTVSMQYFILLSWNGGISACPGVDGDPVWLIWY